MGVRVRQQPRLCLYVLESPCVCGCVCFIVFELFVCVTCVFVCACVLVRVRSDLCVTQTHTVSQHRSDEAADPAGVVPGTSSSEELRPGAQRVRCTLLTADVRTTPLPPSPPLGGEWFVVGDTV